MSSPCPVQVMDRKNRTLRPCLRFYNAQIRDNCGRHGSVRYLELDSTPQGDFHLSYQGGLFELEDIVSGGLTGLILESKRTKQVVVPVQYEESRPPLINSLFPRRTEKEKLERFNRKWMKKEGGKTAYGVSRTSKKSFLKRFKRDDNGLI